MGLGIIGPGFLVIDVDWNGWVTLLLPTRYLSF